MSNALVSLLFPPKCIGCGALLAFQGLDAQPPTLCKSCRRQWESEKLAACAGCGQAVSVCACLTKDLQAARCRALRKLVYYRQGDRSALQNKIIYRIKNAPHGRTADFLAEQLLQAVQDWSCSDGLDPEQTVIVWIPRRRSMVLQTGTDQAKALAISLSNQAGLPYVCALTRRRGRSQPQKRLSYTERRKNVKSVFRIKRGIDLRGKSVILVDDIVTTGMTMAAAARLLHRAGVDRIWCIAPESDSCNQSAGAAQPQFRI